MWPSSRHFLESICAVYVRNKVRICFSLDMAFLEFTEENVNLINFKTKYHRQMCRFMLIYGRDVLSWSEETVDFFCGS